MVLGISVLSQSQRQGVLSIDRASNRLWERERERDWWRNSGTCQKLGTFPSTTEQWTLFKWGYDLNHILRPLYCRRANERAREREEKKRRPDCESGMGEISSLQAVRIQLVSRCGPRLPFLYSLSLSFFFLRLACDKRRANRDMPSSPPFPIRASSQWLRCSYSIPCTVFISIVV